MMRRDIMLRCRVIRRRSIGDAPRSLLRVFSTVPTATLHRGHRVTAHAGWRFATRVLGIDVSEAGYLRDQALQLRVLQQIAPLIDAPDERITFQDFRGGGQRVVLGEIIGIMRDGVLVTVWQNADSGQEAA